MFIFFPGCKCVVLKNHNKEERATFKKFATSQVKVKQLRLQEKLGKQDYQYDVEELYEPITKAVTDTKKNWLNSLKPQLKQMKAVFKIYLLRKVFTKSFKAIQTNYAKVPINNDIGN